MSMRNLLLQGRCEENLRGRRQMLTRDLFAIANLNCFCLSCTYLESGYMIGVVLQCLDAIGRVTGRESSP